MSNPPAQHVINAAVASAPAVSFLANFPRDVTVAVGCLAGIYYVMVIIEKLFGWRAQWLQIKQSSRAVAAKVKADLPDVPEAPDHKV